MSATDPFINFGTIRLNDTPPGENVTVIVVGLPRSGTSMVAAVLKSLGVFIGTKIDNAVFEDREIARALEGGSSGTVAALFATRNAEHRIWGFKRPAAYKQLAKLCRATRHPRVIVTFRDILAISLRNNISMQMDPVKFMPDLAAEHQELISTIRRLSAPCLLISYEKALQFPDRTVAEIASFCGLHPEPGRLDAASAAIESNSPQYIQTARLRYQGRIEGLIDGQLRGWVKVQTLPQVRVNVELELDGKVVETTCASYYRPDLERARIGDGRYGFRFSITDKMNRDSLVNVRIQNSTIVIENSGLPLSMYSMQ